MPTNHHWPVISSTHFWPPPFLKSLGETEFTKSLLPFLPFYMCIYKSIFVLIYECCVNIYHSNSLDYTDYMCLASKIYSLMSSHFQIGFLLSLQVCIQQVFIGNFHPLFFQYRVSLCGKSNYFHSNCKAPVSLLLWVPGSLPSDYSVLFSYTQTG